MQWLIIGAVVILITTQSFYDIPAYYGHFSLNYLLPSYLLTGTLTKLQYHFAVDASYDNLTLYFANQKLHCIYRYHINNQTLEQYLGICGQAGSIIGSSSIAAFNGVSSIAYFQLPSSSLRQLLSQQQVVITADQNCSLSNQNCILSAPYPDLTVKNIRWKGQVPLWTQEGGTQLLFIADTNNHCIKVFSPMDNEVRVVAGICGIQGFQDGPQGYNKLSYPRNLGISRKGTIFFFDSGNQYIRKTDLRGNVYTLLLGACKQVNGGRNVGGIALPVVACYENWVEGQTQSPFQHYFDSSILNTCTNQSSQCEQ